MAEEDPDAEFLYFLVCLDCCIDTSHVTTVHSFNSAVERHVFASRHIEETKHIRWLPFTEKAKTPRQERTEGL